MRQHYNPARRTKKGNMACSARPLFKIIKGLDEYEIMNFTEALPREVMANCDKAKKRSRPEHPDLKIASLKPLATSPERPNVTLIPPDKSVAGTPGAPVDFIAPRLPKPPRNAEEEALEKKKEEEELQEVYDGLEPIEELGDLPTIEGLN